MIKAFGFNNPGWISRINASLAIQPNALSGLAAWIDATDAASITNVSGNASQINDKSGNGNHLTQATAGNRPVIVSSGGQNNLGYLNLSTTGRTIGLASFVLPQPFTVFAVLKQTGFTNTQRIVELGNTYGLMQFTTTLSGSRGSSGNSFGMVATSGYNLPYSLYNKSYNDSSFNPFSAYFSGTNSYFGMDFLNDKLEGDPGTVATSSLTLKGQMQFHELIIYNRELTVSESQSINNYLNSKYAFPALSRYAVFGDSISIGQGGSGVNYTNVHHTLIRNEMNYDRYVNYAVGGQTMNQNFSAYIGRYLRGLPSMSKVAVLLGQNDGDGTLPGWATTYQGYIQQIIDAGGAANNIFLCSPAPTASGTTNTGLRDAVSSMATSFGAKYCNQWQYIADRVTESYTSGDGVHPNSVGQRNLADNLKYSLNNGLTTPLAPTGGVVDDVANTFTFTLASTYPASHHEYRINGGAWADCTSNVISVPGAAAIGAVEVRVKANAVRNASAILSNATAFTA